MMAIFRVKIVQNQLLRLIISSSSAFINHINLKKD